MDYTKNIENNKGEIAVLHDNNDSDTIFAAKSIVFYPPNDHKRCIAFGRASQVKEN